MMDGLFSDHTQAVVILGALLGIAYGAVAQWSGFCAVRGLYHHWYRGDGRKLRAFALAMAVALLVSQWLHGQGVFDLSGAHFTTRAPSWLMIPLGGVLFGIGMALANACGARSLVLLGSGNLRSLVVLLTLGVVAGMALSGVLAPLRMTLEDATRMTLPHTTWGSLLQSIGLSADAGRIAATLTLAGGLSVWALRSAQLRRSPRDWIGGLAIGFMVPAAWFITGHIGADDFEPVTLAALTFVAPINDSVEYLMLSTGTSLKFGVAVVGGILVGSLLMALIRRDFRWQGFESVSHLRQILLGGALMGFGGVMALGCTLGQGLSGFSTLAIMTIPALIGIILGARIGFRIRQSF